MRRRTPSTRLDRGSTPTPQVPPSTLESHPYGRLVRVGGVADRSSDFLPYRLDLEPGVGGSLGVDLPSPSQRRNLDLSRGTEVVRFDGNVVGPTVNATFELEIHTKAKPGLFAGLYQDVITVSIEDL